MKALDMRHFLCLSVMLIVSIGLSMDIHAQAEIGTKDYLDGILERRSFSPEEINDLDQGGGTGGAKDGLIDVRDLVIFLNGLPVSATFGSAESLAFHSAGSVTLPIYFSKPVSGVVRFDLGGSAVLGENEDVTLLSSQIVIPEEGPVQTAQITIVFRPWRGMGGEKVLRLTLKRDSAVIPINGKFSTHLLRIRQFEAGEYVGMLTLPAGSGLPPLPVRIGLSADGTAVCSFQRESTLLGSELLLSWNAGSQGYPTFPGIVEVSLPGETFSRTSGVGGVSNNIRILIEIQRMLAPFGEELDAYLAGFASDEQPALYRATVTLPNLIAAGGGFPADASNPYQITHQGRLALQQVNYSSLIP